MNDVLKTVDVWFLIFLVFVLAGMISVLGGYAVWSLKRIFIELQKSIDELKHTIKELFDHRNDHAERLKAIETRCKIMHKGEACEL